MEDYSVLLSSTTHRAHAHIFTVGVMGFATTKEMALQSICEGIPRAVQLSCKDSSQLFKAPSMGWLPTWDKHEKAN